MGQLERHWDLGIISNYYLHNAIMSIKMNYFTCILQLILTPAKAMKHTATLNQPPKLGPPGAGLPWPANWVVRILGRTMLRKQFTVDQALTDLQTTTEAILKRVSALSDAALEARVLVPKLRGLEDSSRYWSPGMVLEHLCLTTPAMLGLATSLSQGTPVERVVRTADVKPTGERGRGVIQEFADCHLGAGTRTAEALGKDLTSLTHIHPWFGPLTAGDWIRLVAGHARIHQRQLEAILAARSSDS